MNRPNKKLFRGMAELIRPTVPTPQFKPVVVQSKNTFKQPTLSVRESKPVVTQRRDVVSAQGIKRPVAPEVYRTQVKPVLVPTSMIGLQMIKDRRVHLPVHHQQLKTNVAQPKVQGSRVKEGTGNSKLPPGQRQTIQRSASDKKKRAPLPDQSEEFAARFGKQYVPVSCEALRAQGFTEDGSGWHRASGQGIDRIHLYGDKRPGTNQFFVEGMVFGEHNAPSHQRPKYKCSDDRFSEWMKYFDLVTEDERKASQAAGSAKRAKN